MKTEQIRAPSVREVMGKQLPEKKFIASPIAATIWANEAEKDGKKLTFRTVQIDRAYRDKDGEWQHTNSLRINDVPKAVLVLNKAYEYISLVDKESIEEESA